MAARSSCFAFKGRRQDLRTVADTLDVATVLEGTVRRAGSRLRITVQLASPADGYQIWSERYDRELTDVFAVQDEIAAAIAQKLSVTLQEGAGARRGTGNLEAYELLLKGRAFQLRRGRYLADAIECFEAAIALDPDYAEAVSWLADSWRLLGTFGFRPAAEVMPRAKEMAERALRGDAGLAEAWATLADVEAQYEWDFSRADLSWGRALALDPRHTRARCERALWGHGMGHVGIEEALSAIREAVADDPLNSWALSMHAMILSLGDRHEEAVATAERAHAADPESGIAQYTLVWSLAMADRFEDARRTAFQLLAHSGRHHWILGVLGWVFAKLGETANARAVYDEMEARSRYEGGSLSMLAVAAAAAGARDEALALVEQAITDRDPVLILFRGIRFFDHIHADPRSGPVLARVRT